MPEYGILTDDRFEPCENITDAGRELLRARGVRVIG